MDTSRNVVQAYAGSALSDGDYSGFVNLWLEDETNGASIVVDNGYGYSGNGALQLPYIPGHRYRTIAGYGLASPYDPNNPGGTPCWEGNPLCAIDQYGFGFMSAEESPTDWSSGVWRWIPSGTTHYTGGGKIYLGDLAVEFQDYVDDSTPPEMMTFDPVGGFSQNGYGEVNFDSINWEALKNTSEYGEMFADAATWEELEQSCPTIGPLTIPCAVVKGAIFVGAAAVAIESIYQASRGNHGDTGIEQEMQDKYRMFTACQALDRMLDLAQAAGDTVKVEKIKTTQKAYGCRNRQKRGG